MKPFASITTGSRYGHARVESWLSGLHAFRPISVALTGDAPGADTQTVLWAIDNGVFFISVGADWDKHGNRAGPVRNGDMTALGLAFEQAGYVVGCSGFPDANSRGTHNCMSQMQRAGIRTVNAGVL